MLEPQALVVGVQSRVRAPSVDTNPVAPLQRSNTASPVNDSGTKLPAGRRPRHDQLVEMERGLRLDVVVPEVSINGPTADSGKRCPTVVHDNSGPAIIEGRPLSPKNRASLPTSPLQACWRSPGMTSPTDIRRERDLRPTGANRMTRRRRHASALLDAGESLKAVSQYLGHTAPHWRYGCTHRGPDSAGHCELSGVGKSLRASRTYDNGPVALWTTSPSPESAQVSRDFGSVSRPRRRSPGAARPPAPSGAASRGGP